MSNPFVIIFWIFVVIFVFKAIKIIPQWYVWLVKYLWEYTSTAQPGLIMLMPFVHEMIMVDVKEQVINVPEQQVITKDNVWVTVDGVVYVQIIDAKKALFEVQNVFMAVINLAQTTLRSVLGTMTLDETFSNREVINAQLLTTLDRETTKWWVKVMRVEIKKLEPPRSVQDQMNMIKNAQSDKTARITESEGYKIALITKSEADKAQKILEAEWAKQSKILEAEGIAQAKIAIAEADARRIELESMAAQKFFTWNAVVKEQLKVIENSLSGWNTKYILDNDILTSIGKSFGIK